MRIVAINIDEPGGMRGSGLSPACSETLFFHPISAAQPGGAARGVKAGEEFGEERAALILSERPSQGSKANPKFTSWGHGLDTVPREPFGVRELLGGKAKSPRPLLSGVPRWHYGGRGHQNPVGSW